MPGLGDFGERRCVYFRYCAGRHQNGDTDVPSGIARDTLRVAPRFTHILKRTMTTNLAFLSIPVLRLWGSSGLAKCAPARGLFMASRRSGITLFYGRNDRAYKRHAYLWKLAVQPCFLIVRRGFSTAEVSGPRARYGFPVK